MAVASGKPIPICHILNGGVQLAHERRDGDVEANESIMMIKLAREARESVAQTNFLSSVTLLQTTEESVIRV
jgi:hypothetical protein